MDGHDSRLTKGLLRRVFEEEMQEPWFLERQELTDLAPWVSLPEKQGNREVVKTVSVGVGRELEADGFPQQTAYAWYYNAREHQYRLANQAVVDQDRDDEFVCAAPTWKEIVRPIERANVEIPVLREAYRTISETLHRSRRKCFTEDEDMFVCLGTADFAGRVWLYLKKYQFLQSEDTAVFKPSPGKLAMTTS